MENIKNLLSEVWAKIPPAWQEKILSAWHTFLSTFVAYIILTLHGGTLEWSQAFFAGVLLAAFRTALKAAWETIMPPVLGGIRKKVGVGSGGIGQNEPINKLS